MALWLTMTYVVGLVRTYVAYIRYSSEDIVSEKIVKYSSVLFV